MENLLGLYEKNLLDAPDTILYARVSTKKQKEYLENQIKRLQEYAKSRNWKFEVISEIASGVNENRRGLRKLLNKVKRGEVKRVVVEYPDRLARFGFEYLKFFLERWELNLW